MIRLRYHAHLAEFGNGKYLIVTFKYASATNGARFVRAMGILVRLSLANIRTRVRSDSSRRSVLESYHTYKKYCVTTATIDAKDVNEKLVP